MPRDERGSGKRGGRVAEEEVEKEAISGQSLKEQLEKEGEARERLRQSYDKDERLRGEFLEELEFMRMRKPFHSVIDWVMKKIREENVRSNINHAPLTEEQLVTLEKALIEEFEREAYVHQETLRRAGHTLVVEYEGRKTNIAYTLQAVNLYFNNRRETDGIPFVERTGIRLGYPDILRWLPNKVSFRLAPGYVGLNEGYQVGGEEVLYQEEGGGR